MTANLQRGRYASIWTWRFRKKKVSWHWRHWKWTWSRNSWVRLGMKWTLHLLLLAVLPWVPSIWAKCVLSYDDSLLRHEKCGWKLKWIPWITRLLIWANLQWRIAASVWIWVSGTRRIYLFHITSIERLQALTIDDIKKEIQTIMWAHYEVDVCRKDFVLLLDTVRTAANDDSKNQLVKVDHCDPVATVLRQWEMPCGTAAEGVRIRFDPCWKNYVQLTSCTWRPFARPLRHQWKSLRAWPAIKGGCWWHYIELMSCVAGLDVYRFTGFDFS